MPSIGRAGCGPEMSVRLDVWPPLPPWCYFRRASGVVPFPLGEPGVVLLARARHGLFLGVQALGLAPGEAVLAPAYHHGSEIEALVRAGLEPQFYEATETLEPDQHELEQLMTANTRALYLVHYLGFPQDSMRWRRFCDEHGLLLLEDAAQAWLTFDRGRPVGSLGDLAIFCLYKTFGLPDGAALLVRTGSAPHAGRAGRAGAAELVRQHALWLASRSKLASAALNVLTRDGAYSPEQDFALGSPGGPLPASRSLAARVPEDVAARRRAHYRLLLEELHAVVPPPFERLPRGSSPFAFPVATGNKRELLDRLARAGVRALDLWSVPHPILPAERFPAAQARRAGTVGLPVHQELRPADVERVAAASGHRKTSRHELEWIDDLNDAAEDWRRLGAATGNVFATWEWASHWWRRYGRGRPSIVAVRRPGGERFALLPLYRWRDGRLRIDRFLGHGTADELGPVCDPADRTAAARALRQAAARTGCDVLLAEHLPADEGWSSLLGGAVLAREGSPLIRFTGDWEEYHASLSSHFRKKIAWQERKLIRERGLRYRLSDDAGRLAADLDALFALHASRWPQGSAFLEHEPFHREIAARALELGWLRLWLLELDDRPAAAWYGFRFEGFECHLQSGRDPSIQSSVGSLLLMHTIKEALQDGVKEYRFLRGGEDYKQRFASEDPGLETVALAGTWAGRAALAAGRSARTIRPLRSAIGARL